MSRLLLAGCCVLVVVGTALVAQVREPASPNAGAISACIEDLTNYDFQIREEALVSLSAYGPEATEVLIQTLHRQDSRLKRKLAALCSRIPFLSIRTQNTAPLRAKAAEQLSMIREPDARTVKALVLALRDENADVQEEVQRALRRLGAKTVPELRSALDKRDSRIRLGAAQVLGDFGPEAAPATPELLARLKDRSVAVRAEAAHSLGKLGNATAAAALVQRLEDQSPSVRSAAIEALAELNAKHATSALVKRFQDSNAKVRIAAAKAVWTLDQRADLAVPVLVRELKMDAARGAAIFVLGEIGPRAAAAVPALVGALQAERVYRPLRTPPSAALTLGRIGPAALSGLLPLLDDPKPHTRIGAAITLGFLGPQAAAAVPKLLPLLQDDEVEVRQATAVALSSIQPGNPSLIPALKELARDEDIFLASAATAMLRELNPTAPGEIPSE